jgi:hypothetical protein
MKISIEYENSTSEVLPTVEQADFAGAYCVSLTFSDGIQKKVNFGNFLKKSMHPTIRSYLDEKKFRMFTVENGNIVWGKNLDLIFPLEQLYEGKIL